MPPLFALVDCNNIYVSREWVFQPNLTGQPVSVLSNNDGCVVARSNDYVELTAGGVRVLLDAIDAIPPDRSRARALM